MMIVPPLVKEVARDKCDTRILEVDVGEESHQRKDIHGK